MDFNSALILFLFAVASTMLGFLGKKLWDVDKKIATVCGVVRDSCKDIKELRTDVNKFGVDFQIHKVRNHGE